ncbi:MAG: hypothetical protein HC828_03605 [Blastochloris sp.]|nr:hypothetical protein [Blastochloris sp.]
MSRERPTRRRQPREPDFLTQVQRLMCSAGIGWSKAMELLRQQQAESTTNDERSGQA